MQDASIAIEQARKAERPAQPFWLPKLSSVSLVCYPYAPVLSSRGIDRYCFFLRNSLQEFAIPARVIGPAIKPSIRALALTDPRVAWRITRDNSPLFHAVSPVGGRLVAFATRKPLVTTIHDVIPFYLQGYSPLKYAFLRQCIGISARKSDGIIVPFEFTKRFLVDKFGVDPNRIAVVAYGVDLRGFRPGNFREPGGKRILFLGGGFPKLRGGDILLRAFHVASPDLEDGQVILSGTGPEEKILRNLASDLGLAAKVKFPGFIEEKELGQYLQSSSLLVHPSKLGFSLSVLQAMASGTPVIVSDDLDSLEAVGDRRLVCPSGDFNALARAIVRVLTDDDFANMVAHIGYARSRNFSIDQMTLNTFKVYERVMGLDKSQGLR